CERMVVPARTEATRGGRAIGAPETADPSLRLVDAELEARRQAGWVRLSRLCRLGDVGPAHPPRAEGHHLVLLTPAGVRDRLVGSEQGPVRVDLGHVE